MAKPTLDANTPAGVSLLEANARLDDAYAALLGLHALLRQAEDLNEITGRQLAALLCGPVGEVGAAKNELQSVAAPLLHAARVAGATPA